MFCFFAGNRLENILVVAMHLSETGKFNDIRNVIGTRSHPLHSLKMISLLYSNDGIFNFEITTSAVNVMRDFLLSP